MLLIYFTMSREVEDEDNVEGKGEEKGRSRNKERLLRFYYMFCT